MAEEGAEEGNIAEGVEPEPESSPEPGPDDDEDEQGEGEGDPDPAPEEVVEVRAEGEDAEPEADTGEQEAEQPDEQHVAEYAPDVQAFLDRHEGNIEKALRTAVEIQSMLGARNREQGELNQRVAQLEAELAQAQAMTASGIGLTPEQHEWVSSAIESEQPAAYIQSAVQAGEFDLARAICDAWGEGGEAYQALRARQMVDQAEYHAQQVEQVAQPQGPPLISHQDLLGMISEQVPDFADYEPEMVEIISQLGEAHPMVMAAKSQDPNEAAMGLIDIYKAAQTRRVRVSQAREQHEQQTAERHDGAKRRAAVSSSTSRTTHEEPPRPQQIMPGLTLEELETAFAAE
jgi:hypothetical protein